VSISLSKKAEVNIPTDKSQHAYQ